jgi:hypothetical protein
MSLARTGSHGPSILRPGLRLSLPDGHAREKGMTRQAAAEIADTVPAISFSKRALACIPNLPLPRRVPERFDCLAGDSVN